MQKTPLHMLGELFGIKNFIPATPNTAHFELEISNKNYILDAALTNETLVLCLSRKLLTHEENNQDLLQAAARIASEHEPCLAYNKNHCISFVTRLALDASIDVIEKSLENCIACQEALIGY